MQTLPLRPIRVGPQTALLLGGRREPRRPLLMTCGRTSNGDRRCDNMWRSNPALTSSLPAACVHVELDHVIVWRRKPRLISLWQTAVQSPASCLGLAPRCARATSRTCANPWAFSPACGCGMFSTPRHTFRPTSRSNVRRRHAAPRRSSVSAAPRISRIAHRGIEATAAPTEPNGPVACRVDQTYRMCARLGLRELQKVTNSRRENAEIAPDATNDGSMRCEERVHARRS